ncbi:MAG: hypothetical protein NTV34_03660, partial [Proteobacteria bacterium]|nr:hypothetical protein [Pseudomonadota bacterium]
STGSSTTSIDRIRLSRGVRPWKSSSNGKRPDHPPALIRTGAAKGVTSCQPAQRPSVARFSNHCGIAEKLYYALVLSMLCQCQLSLNVHKENTTKNNAAIPSTQ